GGRDRAPRAPVRGAAAVGGEGDRAASGVPRGRCGGRHADPSVAALLERGADPAADRVPGGGVPRARRGRRHGHNVQRAGADPGRMDGAVRRAARARGGPDRAAAAIFAPLMTGVSSHHAWTQGATLLGAATVIRFGIRLSLARLRNPAARLYRLANTDALTGVANRRSWEFELTKALVAAARDQMPVCVVMLDLDHFKAFNDRLGHQAGD